MRAERRVVTVLAADVVSSTRLVEQLGAEDARLILGETLARAVTVVEAYGGMVKDLAGDGVLALFGAPVAHDDDAERAARAALEITADVRRQAEDIERGWGVAGFNVRVGLHTGEVVVGDIGAGGRVEYGAVGDTVNVAARLQSVAPPGGVLVSALTARLVDRVADLSEPTKVELKGKAEPFVVQSLVALHSHATRRSGRSNMLIGRDREWQVAREAIERLAGGQGGIMWVVGDAGLGKTRLLDEMVSYAEERDLGSAQGRCASYGETLPYWPVRDLLRGFFGISAQDPELKQRLAVRKAMEALLPAELDVTLPYLCELLGFATDLAALAPEAVQYRTFEVVGAVLSAWAGRRPGVVIIDDLHWSDPTSLALVESLLPRAETEPLLLVMALRPETARPGWALRERALREYRHVSAEIELAPLADAAQAALIDRLFAGVEMPEETVAKLSAFAGGNPFYLEELVQALHGDGSSEPSLEIPETLEAVILARVDRLEPEWRQVLACAAPLGRSFGLPLLEEVCGLEQAAVRRALHHLRRLDLLSEESRVPHPTFRFKHALIQEAVYRSLLTADRAKVHRRAAQWLAQAMGDRTEALYPLLAYHWLAAGDRDQAITFARLAGDQARDSNALDEAVAHYRTLVRLLDEAERGGEAAGALFQLGTTLHLASRHAEAQEVWDRAFALPVPEPDLPSAEAELRIGAWHLPFDTNPTHGFFAANMLLFQQLYDPLIHPAEGPAMTPGLAERWHVSDDGLVLTLFLRPGLVWNDGAPLDAHQVADSIRASMLPGAENGDLPTLLVLEGAGAWVEGNCTAKEFTGISALDDRTLRFRLSHPAAYFAFMFMYPGLGPYRPDGVGTGAYEVEHMDDQAVVLRRAPGYRRRRGGNVDRISIVAMHPKDSDAAFTRRDLEVKLGAPQDPSLTFHMVTGPSVQTIFWIANAMHTDRHLRLALAHALDRDVIRENLAATDVVATGGLVPAGLDGHTPDIALGFDPDAARRHLEQSTALAPGQPLIIAHSTEQVHGWMDDVIAGWREVLGVEIGFDHRPMAENVGFLERGSHVALWHWVAGYPDPDYFLRILLHSESTTNIAGWRDGRFDALLDQARSARTTGTCAEVMARYHEADRLAVRDEAVVIPLTYRSQGSLVQPYVRGWWHWGAPMQAVDTITVTGLADD